VLTLTATAAGLSSSSSVTITVNAAPSPAPVAMAWDPNTQSYLAGYNLYRSMQSGVFTSAPLNGTSLLTVTSFTDSTVQNGNTYYYAVRAVSTSGVESPNSNVLQVTR
jgi:fibronectin type 3 domain-containing protein